MSSTRFRIRAMGCIVKRCGRTLPSRFSPGTLLAIVGAGGRRELSRTLIVGGVAMTNEPAARRNFLAKMSAGALSLIAGTATAARANPRPSHDGGPRAAGEKSLEGLNGKHKADYDATS